jgi:hypothetical protein
MLTLYWNADAELAIRWVKVYAPTHSAPTSTRAADKVDQPNPAPPRQIITPARQCGTSSVPRFRFSAFCVRWE